jgi:phage terminase large subunit-like protein
MRFFEAGKTYLDRAVIAGNRVGKTEGIGGYELTCHLTGIYPKWWKGYRFNKPIKAWASGKTGKTTRDILQSKLLGPIDQIGTGIIPGDHIVNFKRAGGGIPDQIESATIRHSSGMGNSLLVFKSYEQGRGAFEGTEQDVILLDEETPADIRSECLLRLMATGKSNLQGLLILTFTPLDGLTDIVLTYLPGGKIVDESSSVGQYLIMIGWDDAPHLSKEDKDLLFSLMPPYQRDARTKGIPQLGSGAIYPIPEDQIKVEPFEIPAYWPRSFSLDVGWNRTAAIWGAIDNEAGIGYLYSEYYRGQAEPPIHAEAIKTRGAWIPGVIDPAARGRGQQDGLQLLVQYQDLGLDLTIPDNSVEAGLYKTWTALSVGQLKVFGTLQNWFDEYRIYRRDDKGKVVKERDHLMDATRYWQMTGRDIAIQEPPPTEFYGPPGQFRGHPDGWMAM